MLKANALGAVVYLLCVACAPPEPEIVSIQSELTGAELASAIRGGVLYAHEDFNGNGRTCTTCHVIEGGERFTLDIEEVNAEFAEDPTGPLFADIDSDDGVGSSFTLMRDDANARIPLDLPPNVTCAPVDGLQCLDGGHRFVARRSTPTSINIALNTNVAGHGALMWDGREGGDLAGQAISAVETHFGASARLPTAQEAADIAMFQRTLFSRPSLAIWKLGTGPAPTLPVGFTAAQRRGREMFVDSDPFVTGKGQCAGCHGGAELNTLNPFNNILGTPGARITTNFSSELAGLMAFQHGHRAQTPYTFTFTLPAGPGPGGAAFYWPDLSVPPGPMGFAPQAPGAVRVIVSSDPGDVLVSGNPCGEVVRCILNPGSTASGFAVPTLWGVAHTAPYFHDNSARDLDEVLDHYEFFFNAITAPGLVGIPTPAFPAGVPLEVAERFHLDEGELADIRAYLELL